MISFIQRTRVYILADRGPWLLLGKYMHNVLTSHTSVGHFYCISPPEQETAVHSTFDQSLVDNYDPGLGQGEGVPSFGTA